MKFCAIQPPYGYNAADAAAAVDFIVSELDRCDVSCDLILTPEYSNAPGTFGPGEPFPFALAHTEKLVDAAVRAAKRCDAAVALSGCLPDRDGKYCNLTRVYLPDGTIAGEYRKQHLTPTEPTKYEVDASYLTTPLAPPIVEAKGLRLAFLTCYDTYFDEYIARIAAEKPDVVLVASFQRGERCDILRMMNAMLGFRTGAYVLRASLSMGENSECGGTSLVADPAGKILADFGQRTGRLDCEIPDPHWKYRRSNTYGGAMILNTDFIEQGRRPWSYRACGSSVCPGDREMPYPRVCAHRGFNTIAPENTLPAFGAAIALGADEIEFDVRETADGELIALHDPRLDRVSDGTGQVCDYTYEELLKFDFGARVSRHFAGLRILKFEEILRRFPRQTVMNIHVKTGKESPRFSVDTVRRIAELLRRYDCAEHAYFMGSPLVHEAALEVAPDIPRCMGAGSTEEERLAIIDRAIEWKCAKVQFFKPVVSPELVRRAHAEGILCNVFWSDDPEEARRFFEWGIDTVLSNDYWPIAQVRDRFLRDRRSR